MNDGSRRARFGAFVREYTVREALTDAWDEHRGYVGFATALFLVGVIIGIALVLAGYNLIEFMLELLDEELVVDEEMMGEGGQEIELSAQFFVLQNTPPFVLSILGAVTIGLLTVAIMVFNGVLVGNIAYAIGQETGFGLILALLLPHGIFELPALFIAAGVGFRLLHRFVQRVRGTREAFVTKPYLYRTGILVLLGYCMLLLAAFIEAYVTIAVAELLFPSEF
ncbi:stage II sporulation protein M [Halobacteria archaeon AArc-m2/3/4]|uniref:Stage II sporulation protein M n=1 Tax=Natronoglomus mannanivorans TaxID=2979990 RepID=A0ABT2QB49_9EURY|nr:stage II sporulation protein M [Halobacteria archaeon AArc-m2/3/4]